MSTIVLPAWFARCLVPLARAASLGLFCAVLLCGLAACGDKSSDDGDAEHGHAHDGDGEHEHDGEDPQPDPIDVQPGGGHGPHSGMIARLSSPAEADFGFIELKLHDDKGDLELWLARDREITKPFDLPLATKMTVTFTDREGKLVELAVRNTDKNEDEDGVATVRKGQTNYFIFPGTTGADAAWLMGTEFKAMVRVSFAHDDVAYVSDDFELRPHGHGDHGHAHDDGK